MSQQTWSEWTIAIVGAGALFTTHLSGCPPSVPAIVPSTGCEAACKHLTDLGCEEGGPECLSRCEEYESAGLDQHTGCLAHVTSCEDTVLCAAESETISGRK